MEPQASPPPALSAWAIGAARYAALQLLALAGWLAGTVVLALLVAFLATLAVALLLGIAVLIEAHWHF